MVEVSLSILAIISMLIVILLYIFYKLGMSKKEVEWQKNIQHLRTKIADKQRASVKGAVAETFAPYLGDFPFKPSECKFLGDPIDYVVFEGLNERNITGIHFVDVKADSSQLKKHQKQIQDIIEKKRKMKFVTYRFRST